MEFPLENKDKYKARIRFRPYITIPPNISTKIGISEQESVNSSDLQSSSQNPTLDQRNPIISKTQEVRHSDEIVLFMPRQVQIMDGVNIQNLDFGAFGTGVERAISSGSGIAEALASNTMSTITSFMDALSGNIDAEGARVLASRTSSMFTPESVSGSIQSALRTTPNPNTRMIFKSVNIREFAFDFTMIPTSEAETQSIKKIIHTFRKHLYPKTIELEGTGIPIAYRFPNTFQIDMYYGDQNLSEINPSLKFQRMYLRQFTSTYNPNSMGFYKKGDFNEVQITLAFTETKALTYDDIASEREQIYDGLIDTYGRDAYASRGFRL